MKKLLLAFLLLFGVLVTTQTVEARHTNGIPVVWFTTAHKGFYHSRYASPRQSIQIGPMPTNEGFPVSWIYGPWNEAAGWALFKPVSVPTGPQQVLFKADLVPTSYRGAWVESKTIFSNGYLNVCVIHYDPSRVGPQPIYTGLDQWGMAHELGHCLGFRDHLNSTSTPGAPQCVAPSSPNYSAYRGVMEYCNWFSVSYRTNVWFKSGDRASLYHYSYGLRSS